MSDNLYPANPILIVDDEKQALTSYEYAFQLAGINNLILCNDSRKVMGLLAENKIELMILDIMMPYVTGDELLAKIRPEYPEIPVIMVTGVNEVNTAVTCMGNGAFDYILKPVDMDRLVNGTKKIFEMRELHRVNASLKECVLSAKLKNSENFSHIVTQNQGMLGIFQYCEAIANSRQPVLITGETGAGKELFAKAIHYASGCPGEFVPVNIAGLEDNMVLDTLFGHRKGAFTGAVESRAGLIEKASNGTLFLDEIGDLDIQSQVKLLRLLQEKEYSALGSDVSKRSNARVVLATNKSLDYLKNSDKFRKDLYYRITTHQFQIPPLRGRKDDLRLLLDHLVEKSAKELKKKPPTYHPELLNHLRTYDFPGNVRELEAMVFNAVSSHDSKMLSNETFISYIKQESGGQIASPVPSEDTEGSDVWTLNFASFPTIKEATDHLVWEAMIKSNGNQSVAARLLGITPQALSVRLKKLAEIRGDSEKIG